MASSGRTRWLNPGYTRYTRNSSPKLRDDLFRYGLALEHLILVEPQSAQEEGIGGRIEIAEIVGEIHDSGGIAVSPFDGHLMAVYEHAVSFNPLFWSS